MNITIDKFGRILLPKIVRQALGISPGEKLVLELDEQRKSLFLTPVAVEEDSEYIAYSENGWPMLNFDFKLPNDFDIVEFMKETRDEYLNKKLGVR